VLQEIFKVVLHHPPAAKGRLVLSAVSYFLAPTRTRSRNNSNLFEK